LITKLLTEPRNNAMMETPMTMTDAQAHANWNVVMDLLLELKSVIWEPTMLMLPTNVNLPARPLNAVMDMLITLRNVIMLPLVHLLQLAETTANSHTVETILSMLFMERIVITVSLETTIFLPVDVQLVAPKILVDMSDLLQLETSTEPWPVQDAFMPMLVPPLVPHAVDPSNGWLPNLFKKSLNSKLTNSNTFGEIQLRDLKRVIANSLILTL